MNDFLSRSHDSQIRMRIRKCRNANSHTNIFHLRFVNGIFSHAKGIFSHNYMILDGLEGDTRIYCQRC